MTDAPSSNDDWLNAPAAPPRALGEPAHAAPKAGPANVTPLRPVHKLADDLDNAPQVAGPDADSPRPGDGLDPSDNPYEGGDLPPAEDIPVDRGGHKRGEDRPRGEIWKGCPVQPLGYLGAVYYYLDPLGQLRGLTKHDAQNIMMLFAGKLPKLYFAFPKMVNDKNGGVYRKPEHFEHQLACSAMITACGERGLFNPEGSVRGVGAWTDDDGNLVYHTGDKLLIGDQALDPAMHMGKIYPAYPAIPHPAEPGKVTKDDAVDQLLETAGSWAWERPEIDPFLFVGIFGIQALGGALGWRPTVWVSAERGAGKSSLQELMKHLHGPKGLIQSTDTTKSGITSQIGHSSLPVALDELEPSDAGSGKEKAIIELARVASSGGQWLRGSADQKGASGNIYSSFLFSSILIPGALTAADRSRMIIMSLKALPEATPPLKLRAETWRKRGAAIKRALIDRWPTWQARYDLWREALEPHKISGRNADNYATVLAMAQMAQSEALPTPEELTGWSAKVAEHVRSSIDDIGNDADDIVTHLLSQQFDPFRRGERLTIAAWIKAAGWRPRAGRRLFGQNGQGDAAGEEYVASLEERQTLAEYAKKANTSLAAVGLRVIGTAEAPELFIATSQMQGLKDLFEKSAWSGGAWSQSLKRIKGAYSPKVSKYLDGHQTKGTVVPFTSMPGLLAFDGDAVMTEAEKAAPPIGMEDMY